VCGRSINVEGAFLRVQIHTINENGLLGKGKAKAKSGR
jgi:hypothetical protein